MDTNTKYSYWLNKKAKIEIFKDDKKLIFTGYIMDISEAQITFLDRFGCVYSFNWDLVREMVELPGDRHE